jgi:hypothetical protein
LFLRGKQFGLRAKVRLRKLTRNCLLARVAGRTDGKEKLSSQHLHIYIMVHHLHNIEVGAAAGRTCASAAALLRVHSKNLLACRRVKQGGVFKAWCILQPINAAEMPTRDAGHVISFLSTPLCSF